MFFRFIVVHPFSLVVNMNSLIVETHFDDFKLNGSKNFSARCIHCLGEKS